ncbi:MAG: UvrB/UvrC motif-containing protein [Phycisphaerales bacterium]|nr:UvrB/UvrC motif-containing protein [Phycisphaerales bacterium]
MKCQKCAKPAIVHLTEVIHEALGVKRAVEMHLCLGHAVEAGLVVPGSELLPQVTTGKPGGKPGGKKPEGGGAKKLSGESEALPTTMKPASSAPTGGLTVTRGSSQAPTDPMTCPVCGLTWTQFKQTGLMGCPHDYELFERKLLPLLKRAQEGANEHIGKVPPQKKTRETDRQVASLRLRRELQKAIDAENYEKAARLRDELRTIETKA